MILGPYSAPMALASRPMMIVFWAVLAPTLASYLIVAGANIGAGGELEVVGHPRLRFLLLSIAYGLVFAGMSFWSDRIGAGPFGGPMRSTGDWIAIGAVTGPVVMTVTTMLVALLFAGQDPSTLRKGADTSLFTAEALSPLMVLAAVLLIPLVEEIGFRGFGMGCLLARGWHPVAANLVVAGGFTALHSALTPLALIPVFIMGLYLGALRVVSQSMAAPLAAHISANAVTVFVFAISVS